MKGGSRNGEGEEHLRTTVGRGGWGVGGLGRGVGGGEGEGGGGRLRSRAYRSSVGVDFEDP